ncbi:MAG TPA: Scr1 family TA system antitoxin-like transcriptional regulator [Bacillota bacterium]|nr:Scr1 family TA system antitoxin-like transcriptional regulator [Bacillota bacterium]
MATSPSPHGLTDPFTAFMELERTLAPGPDVSHMVYVSSDLVPGTLQTEAYWRAHVAHVPELGAFGEAWGTAIWHERQERATLIATAPGIVPHYYIGVAALTQVAEICRPADALEQLMVLRAAIEQPNARLRLSSKGGADEFYGHYQFGDDRDCGMWPNGVWYEQLDEGAAHVDPVKDPRAARYYADVVETLRHGSALSEANSAVVLDLTAESIAAGRRIRWQPEVATYLWDKAF